jgi:hypothetical protein
MCAHKLPGAEPTESGKDPQDYRIELKIPLSLKSATVAALVGALLMALVCLASLGAISYSLVEGKTDLLPADGISLIGTTGFVAIEILGLVFFGSCVGIAFQRLLRPNGWLRITPQELTLRCYSLGPMSGIMGGFFCAGIAEWSNVSQFALKRRYGANCLGIAFTDLKAFLAASESISDEQVATSLRRSERWNGIVLEAFALMPILGKAGGLFVKLIGYSGIPKSAEDIDVLEWNHKNWGYHVLTPVWLIPGEPRDLIELIQKYHSAAISNQTAEGLIASEPSLQATNQSTEARLRELDRLWRLGLIGKHEYQVKHKQILAEL